MSGEGEATEEARKVVVSENEGNTAYLSGEVIMDSVGSPEEEVKLNTPIPATHLHICKSPPLIGVVTEAGYSEQCGK